MKASTLNTLDKAVQRRVRLEEQVIRDIVKAVLPDVQYFLVYDDEDCSERLTTWTQVKNTIHECDEERLAIRFKPDVFGHGDSRGEIVMLYLVYGNDGYDVVCNWSWGTIQAHDYMEPIINKATDRAERGL